jgi:hypothetical protein
MTRFTMKDRGLVLVRRLCLHDKMYIGLSRAMVLALSFFFLTVFRYYLVIMIERGTTIVQDRWRVARR